VGRWTLICLAVGLGTSACSFSDLNDLKSKADEDAGVGGGAGDAAPGTQPNGALCAGPESCESGFCVSGVCCNTKCDGICMACTASAKESGEVDGVCGPAKAGTDPHTDCPDDGADTCQRDGKCDGKGECSLYPAGATCSGSTCTDGVKTLPKLCNGEGTCTVIGIVACEPPECAGNLCLTDCIDDSGCLATEYCEPVTNNCVDKLVQGAACATPNQCLTGFCVDNSCCESACGGACMACSAALGQGQDGQCTPVLAGADPKGDCEQTPAASCGTDGECNGNGGCRLYGGAAICAASSCMGGVQTNAKSCDGAGNCASNGTTSCAPYLCGGTTCLTSCTSSSQCTTGSVCSGNACSGQKSNGQSCGSGNECASGFCADGVCCNVACAGTCQACSNTAKGAGADGVCENVQPGLDPHGSCAQTAQATCGDDGTCDGNGGCRKWPAGTVCAASGCGPDPGGSILFYQSYADTCDGAGVCVDKAGISCGLYACGGEVCKVSCQQQSDCVIGTCNGANVCSICSVGSVGRPASGRDTTWLGLAVVFFLLRRQRARK
jgi:hypothetical protein